MRRSTTAILALLLTLCSCIEMEQIVTIRPDGSGTHKVVLWMDRTVESTLKTFAPAAQPSGAAIDPLKAMEEDYVRRELEGTGLELIKHAKLENGRRRGFEVEIGFDSLEELRKSPLMGTRTQWEFRPGPKPGTRFVVLYPQGKDGWKQSYEKAKAMKGAEMDPAIKASAEKWFADQKRKMGSMDVRIKLQLPTKVVDATRNLKVVDQGVEFRFQPESVKTPDVLVRYLAPRFIAVVEDKGIQWPNDS